MDEEKKKQPDGVGESQKRSGSASETAKEKQQQSKCKKARPCSPTSSFFSAQVLKAIAASHFLTAKELGRLLLLSSKELTVSAFSSPDDEIWKHLVLTHMGNEQGEAMLQAIAPMSAEQCFRQVVLELPLKYTEPRPLQYAPKDYLIIVSMRDHVRNQPVYHKAIPGQDISFF